MSQDKLKELAEAYKLDKDDFWQLPQNKSVHILTHDACEKIAGIEGVRYEKPEWLSRGENGVWAVQASGFKSDDPENILWTTGEASKDNCTAKYLVNMAEKRAKDRLVLKLIKAYEYGIKSEEEADSYKKPEDDKPVEKPSGSNGQKELTSSLAERQATWDKLEIEARSEFSETTWKSEVQEKLIQLYGESHGYDNTSHPVKVLEVSELHLAYKSLFPSLVDEE